MNYIGHILSFADGSCGHVVNGTISYFIYCIKCLMNVRRLASGLPLAFTHGAWLLQSYFLKENLAPGELATLMYFYLISFRGIICDYVILNDSKCCFVLAWPGSQGI